MSSALAASDEIVTKKSGTAKNALITVNEDDWEQMLTGEWMIELFVWSFCFLIFVLTL